jgi:uncharacterized protein YdhG (YjbR/CyaY superfamily)
MKKHLDENDFETMVKNTLYYKSEIEKNKIEEAKILREENIKKEFINSLHKLYPNAYSADSREWTDKLPMKKHLDENDFETMVKNTLYYKSEIKKNKIKILREENIKKAQELETLKSLLAQKENEVHDKGLVKNKVIDKLQIDNNL